MRLGAGPATIILLLLGQVPPHHYYYYHYYSWGRFRHTTIIIIIITRGAGPATPRLADNWLSDIAANVVLKVDAGHTVLAATQFVPTLTLVLFLDRFGWIFNHSWQHGCFGEAAWLAEGPRNGAVGGGCFKRGLWAAGRATHWVITEYYISPLPTYE